MDNRYGGVLFMIRDRKKVYKYIKNSYFVKVEITLTLTCFDFHSFKDCASRVF